VKEKLQPIYSPDNSQYSREEGIASNTTVKEKLQPIYSPDNSQYSSEKGYPLLIHRVAE